MDSEGGRQQPSNSRGRGENARSQGRHHYLQLAGDIAVSLAEIQVPQRIRIPEAEMTGSNEVMLVDESRQQATGDATWNRRGARNLQITAGRGLPSSEPHIPRTGNCAEDQTNQEDLENSTVSDQQAVSHQQPKPRTNPQGRSHYIQIASHVAVSLSELRVPSTNDGAIRERENVVRHVEGIINGRESSGQIVSSRQGEKIRETIPQQESLSEYNGDAICGTRCYDSQEEAYPGDHSGSSSQVVASDSPSIMERNRFASTSSILQSSTHTFEDRTTSRSKEFQLQSVVGDVMLSNVRLENSSGFCVKEEGETCYAEPYTKKSKRNPEVSEEDALPVMGEVSLPEVSKLSLPGEGVEARPEACMRTGSSEVEWHQSRGFESEQQEPIRNPDSVKNLPRAQSRDDSPTDSCLGAEFQSLNVAESDYRGALNVSLPSTRNEDTSFQKESSNDNSLPTLNSPRSSQYRLTGRTSLYSTDALANVSRSPLAGNLTRVDREMQLRSDANEPAGFRAQGSRPKTCQQQCKRSKFKPRTVKKKESHSSLSADIDGDCEAMNRQLGSPPVATNGFQRQGVVRGISKQNERPVGITETSRTTSRQQRDPVRTGHASQNAQKSLADDMAPTLQALVIQMLEQDEERLGIHIVNGIRLDQGAPPEGHSHWGHRGVPHGPRGNPGERSCAVGASHQPQGKKTAKKSAKKKSHYVELADLISPELAVVNRTFTNQQQGRQQHQQAAERREMNRANTGAQQMAVDVEFSSASENFMEPLTEARDHSRDVVTVPQQLFNQRDATDCTVPRVGSVLPLSATNQREANVERSSPYLSENLPTVTPRRERRHGRHVNRNCGM